MAVHVPGEHGVGVVDLDYGRTPVPPMGVLSLSGPQIYDHIDFAIFVGIRGVVAIRLAGGCVV